ncbi:hypothetical protein GCM10027098_06950 [Bowmanella dokdonensis]
MPGLLLLLACTGMARADDKSKPVPEQIQSQLQELMQRYQVPGMAVARIGNGRVIWQGALGRRNSTEPVTRETVFNVASLTKPLFAALVMQLVAEGKLDLDENLSQHWVDPDLADDPRHQHLTPRILLSHQSGLPNWRGERKLAFMFAPGERHEYSGEGFEYLRRAVEKKTGRSLSELMQARVLAPAGMTHTSMGWDPAMDPQLTQRFDQQAKPVEMGDKQRTPNAAANTFSTIADMGRFAAWVTKGAGLPDNLFTQMASPQALHDNPAELFGLGWKLAPLASQTALMHDGREAGLFAQLVVLPQDQEAMVMLTNSTNGELLRRPVIRLLLPQGEALVKQIDKLVWRYIGSIPPAQLGRMSGFIARSPAFTSTLLHAANSMLVQPSDLAPERKQEAADVIDQFVLDLFEGRLDSQRAVQAIEQLLVQEENQASLKTAFSAAGAAAWLDLLQGD